ncbi:ABC transporter G family member 22 [Amaranthus tricolor]|uniref:ABC transporter G family member 22 n=1 Tax=Amaranthus tricolor TaxID=29722 RepID=UPI00258601B6|nr:ABC transporter G family member 22 [Amaranthus tricolor]
MDKVNSTIGLVRTKSDQLVETVAAAMAAMKSSPSTDGTSNAAMGPTAEGSRKSSRRITSPGGTRNSSSRHYNSHIRKTRSAQLKLDIDDLSNGAALSRASSASLGLSFSFTGFNLPPEDIADSKPFSDDDDIPEDIEAGPRKKRIEAEPTWPICLKFKEVTYKVILKGVTSSEEKEILHGITGSVDPGEVLALMGPSGSGKTTLLNVLGGRLSQHKTGGSVTYNDEPYSKYLKSRIGFVTQDDVLYPHLTVRETLTFAAYLRLPKTLTKQQKKQRALDVIGELGLERCQDTMIGGSFVRGVSGGERKRVCIGNEILINPSLLFLDEPTSGLDSTTALRIIQLLHDIAEDGKTVITTIHQPSSRLFHKFDKLILLGKGSLLYFGKASQAIEYFSSIGCSPLISMNPAEFLLDLANGNLNDVTVPSELEDKVHIDIPETDRTNGKPFAAVIHEYLVESYESRVAQKEKKKLVSNETNDKDFKSLKSFAKREWGASWWQQYSILFRRGIKERRHEYFSWLRVTQVLATAVVLGLLWWHSDTKTEKGLEDQAGLLFFIGVFWGFFPVFTAIFAFPQERAMLQKERAADMYRLSAYFLARTTSDLPLDLVLPVLFLLVVYFMAGLRLDAVTFILTVLTVFLCIVAAQGLGLAIGASLMDIKKATTLGSVTVMTFMLAGGYFVKKVPVFIAWLRYLSFNYHTYRLLLKVHYEHHIQTTSWMKFDSGLEEVSALIAMVFGYRLLAYIFLRRMRLQ